MKISGVLLIAALFGNFEPMPEIKLDPPRERVIIYQTERGTDVRDDNKPALVIENDTPRPLKQSK